MKKKDEFSLVNSSHSAGSKLLQEAHRKSIAEMQEKVVGDVQQIVKRKANLEVQAQQIDDQVGHLQKQLDAINRSQFTVIRGKIHYEDEALNQDCAVAYPFYQDNI